MALMIPLANTDEVCESCFAPSVGPGEHAVPAGMGPACRECLGTGHRVTWVAVDKLLSTPDDKVEGKKGR